MVRMHASAQLPPIRAKLEDKLQEAVTRLMEDILERQRLKSESRSSEDCAPLFQSLSMSSMQTLLSHSHVQNYAAHQHIVRHGDAPAWLYYILEGHVKTLRNSIDGKEATIRMLKAGETFMDAVIFMGGKVPIDAIALEDSKVLMIPAETVRRHVLHDPQFSCNLLRIIAKHYKNAIQQIDNIAIKNPVARLGYYFLQLHLEQGAESLDIALPFQKSIIANHLGMTPETFSRALNQIKKNGINVDQEKLTLRDAYALCHFCDTDTAHICPQYNTADCPLSTEACHSGNNRGCH